MSPERSDIQNRRGWIMVATTFVTLAVIYGVWYSYSVFLVALVREFGWSRSLVSGAFSFFVLVHGGLGPVVGWMARRFGPRRLFLIGGVVMGAGLALTAETSQVWHLYLAFGGITAIGISLAGWVPAVILVQGWFPRRFGRSRQARRWKVPSELRQSHAWQRCRASAWRVHSGCWIRTARMRVTSSGVTSRDATRKRPGESEGGLRRIMARRVTEG